MKKLALLLLFSSIAHADTYGNLDELHLDAPKVGTPITLHILGCKIADDSYEREFNLKCQFVHGAADAFLYISKQEAKDVLRERGYFNYTCNLRELGKTYVTCTK